MSKIAIYARESESDTTKAPPIENQIEIGKKWAEANGHEVYKVYADNGYSGGDWKRPEFHWILADARCQKFSVIWIASQEILTTDTETFLWFYRHAKEKNCGIYIANEELKMKESRDRHVNTIKAILINSHAPVERTVIPKVRGRAPIPREHQDLVLWTKAANPTLGYRKLAAIVPPYIKEYSKEGKPIYRKASYVWVREVLKTYQTRDLTKKPALESIETQKD